jgi:hypothetical protein
MDWEAGEENDDPPMVARFKSLHKELRDSINKMAPRPLMTAAVATSWYPNCTAAIAGYVDQLNNMSYYNPVTDLDWIFEPVLDQGVSKALQGVGFGFDSDDEITDVHDIAAKCRYAIDKGYGGIMVWDITHAPASTSDSIAKYVSLSHTSIVHGASPGRGLASSRGMATLSVRSKGSDGTRVISYSSAADVLDLGLYDMKGSRIRTLAHGPGAGPQSLILEGGSRPGSLRPGAYVLKLSSGSDAGIAKPLHIP